MSKSPELTDQDRQRLHQIKNNQQQQGSTSKIKDCDKLRTDFRNGVPLEGLCDEYQASSETIRKHLKGDCICEADVDAVEYYGHERALVKVCPYCGFGSRYFADVTEHIWGEHDGGGD